MYPNKDVSDLSNSDFINCDWILNIIEEKSEILLNFYLDDAFTKIEKGSESKWKGTSTCTQDVKSMHRTSHRHLQ